MNLARQNRLFQALLRACREGNTGAARKALDDGADFYRADPGGWTPLHMAARWGHIHIVRMLLSRGAPLDSRDAFGQTPLDLAEKPEIRAMLQEHMPGIRPGRAQRQGEARPPSGLEMP